MYNEIAKRFTEQQPIELSATDVPYIEQLNCDCGGDDFRIETRWDDDDVCYYDAIICSECNKVVDEL